MNLEIVKAGLAEVYRRRPAFGFGNDPYWEAEKVAKADLREMWLQGKNTSVRGNGGEKAVND